MPNLCGEDDLLNSSSDEEGWMEFGDEGADDDENTLCLFCSHESKSVAVAMTHVKKEHGVDFHILKRKFNMDQYSFIKVLRRIDFIFTKVKIGYVSQMINYIRINKVEPVAIASAEECQWNEEKYLKPLAFEPWLMFGNYL